VSRQKIITLVCGFLLVAGWPALACQPHTPLEEVYCQLVSKGEKLPSLEDFRRNQPRIQALLLKAPARKHGIRVPSPGKNTSAQKKAPAKRVPVKASHSQSHSQFQPQTKRQQPTSVRDIKSKSQMPEVSATGMTGCALQGRTIRCSQQNFQLVNNLPNRQLSPSALSEKNTLGLTNYKGKSQDERALKKHLSLSYQRYIEQMLSIGLGASTMSYSKFYYTYEELQRLQVDFAERFETMFGYLKKDKASMAIKDSYVDALPASINACVKLQPSILVCDNGIHNWIYIEVSH
jgi:hypothetical protein